MVAVHPHRQEWAADLEKTILLPPPWFDLVFLPLPQWVVKAVKITSWRAEEAKVGHGRSGNRRGDKRHLNLWGVLSLLLPCSVLHFICWCLCNDELRSFVMMTGNALNFTHFCLCGCRCWAAPAAAFHRWPVSRVIARYNSSLKASLAAWFG